MGNDIEIICNLIMSTPSFPKILDKDYSETFVELVTIKTIEELKSSKNSHIKKGLEELKQDKKLIDKLKEYKIDIKILN